MPSNKRQFSVPVDFKSEQQRSTGLFRKVLWKRLDRMIPSWHRPMCPVYNGRSCTCSLPATNARREAGRYGTARSIADSMRACGRIDSC